MRLGPAAGGRGGAGPVLEGLHPRHGAGLPARRPSSSWRRSSSRPGRRCSTAAATSSRGCKEIFAELQPDVIVEDNVVGFPAVVTADAPWVRIVSCNPLEMPDPDLRARVLGLPGGRPLAAGTPSAPSTTARHRDAVGRTSTSGRSAQGAPALPDLRVHPQSPDLNLYLYPRRGRLPRGHGRSARPGSGSTRACAGPRPAASSCPSSLRDGDRLADLPLAGLARPPPTCR